MVEFAHPFSGLTPKHTLTHQELIRAIRQMVAAEYEAVQLYTQLAEATNNPLAAAVLTDIAREELVHAGEFLRLLQELAPDETRLYEEGSQEVEELIRRKAWNR